MTEAIQTIENIVSVHDGHAVTDSLKVAQVFGKQHKHVLEAIRNLQIPDEDRLPNFRPTVITRPNPSGGKDIASNAYTLTRDGFTILAMSIPRSAGLQTLSRAVAFRPGVNVPSLRNRICSAIPC